MENDDARIYGKGVPRKKRSNRRRIPRIITTQTLERLLDVMTTHTPEWLLDVMSKEDNADDPKQIIKEKVFFASDINTDQARFSIPSRKVRTVFLSEDERRLLEESDIKTKHRKGLSVVFVDPTQKKYDVELKKWKKYLVIAKGWNKVLKDYEFKVGEKFPLWSFRSVSRKLVLALGPKVGNDSDGGSVPGSVGQDGGSIPGSAGHDDGSVPASAGQDGGSIPGSAGQDGGSISSSAGHDDGSIPASAGQDGGSSPGGHGELRLASPDLSDFSLDDSVAGYLPDESELEGFIFCHSGHGGGSLPGVPPGDSV